TLRSIVQKLGWLYTTKPGGDTKEPEPPLLNLTEASCAFFSHSSVTSNPYFFLISARGTLLNVHMPSSASATTFSACKLNSAMKSADKNFLNFICILNKLFVREKLLERFGPEMDARP